MQTRSVHHLGWSWLAIAGFALFAVGVINPLTLRATAREGPLRPIVSNTLMVTGFAFIILGLILRSV